MILAALAAGLAFQAPVCLIVDRRPAPETEEDARLPLARALAGSLRAEGRVLPVVWSQDDPLFALAAAEGRAPSGVTVPSSRQIAQGARGLGAGFVLMIESTPSERGPVNRATLLEGGKREPAWQSQADPLGAGSIEVRVDGRLDLEAMAESIVRTWSLQLTTGPFRPFLRPEAPVGDPMASPPPVAPEAVFVLSSDPNPPAEAAERALELADSGQTALAVLVLQDAIDRDPLAMEPRAALCRLHLRQGHAKLAAQEARQAASIAREASGLWLLAGEASLLDSDPSAAAQDLMQAQARGLPANETARLESLIGLFSNRPGDALVRTEDFPEMAEAAVIRAAAQGRLGLPFAPPLPAQPFQPSPLLYHVFLQASRRDFEAAAEEIRSLPVLAAQASQGDNLVRRAEALLAQCQGWGELMSSIQSTEKRKASHGMLVLAQRLLQQSSAEVLAFVRGSDPDAGKESAISLGEALKLIRAADEQRALEG
jgi:hypothetical protein